MGVNFRAEECGLTIFGPKCQTPSNRSFGVGVGATIGVLTLGGRCCHHQTVDRNDCLPGLYVR